MLFPRFVPNPLFPGQLLRSTILLDDLEEQAQEIADAAKELAPVLSGAYRDGLVGVAGQDGGEVQGRVVGRDFKSGWIEFGTSDTPAFAPIRRAAESKGYNVEARS